MIDPSLFTCCFNAFLMLLRNSILNRISLQCSYAAHLFEEVDWPALAGYQCQLHL